jgi:hypothetical protein
VAGAARVTPRRLAAAALAAAAMAGTGCASQETSDVTAVADRFHAAVANGDGAAACSELAPETRSKLEQEEKSPCAEAILEVELPRDAQAGDAGVYVTSATVALGGGRITFLDQFADGWKVSADGCTKTAPDGPYDCELEG